MSKQIIVLTLASIAALVIFSQVASAQDHYLLHNACAGVLNDQINLEMYASLVYLNMAGYFDRPTVALPGYAKFFKDQSLEEYGHASKLIEYINKRNSTVDGIRVKESTRSDWSSPREALGDAIELEKHVYSKLQHIHNIADQQCQDAHLTDFLEGYFFTEQVDSIRELQHMLTKLSVANEAAASVIEHMEDAKLKDNSKTEL